MGNGIMAKYLSIENIRVTLQRIQLLGSQTLFPTALGVNQSSGILNLDVLKVHLNSYFFNFFFVSKTA